jgi:bifunctional DNA-binding transcriptional regulator/antitoxin component of YhaV-PrlF toxin-antitoxin module
MNKKIQTKTESYIQFSEEEIEQFGWEPNQKLSITVEDGNIILTPFKKLEIDLDEFTKDDLIELIALSLEEDKSMNEVFEDIIKLFIKNHEE